LPAPLVADIDWCDGHESAASHALRAFRIG
jgi:hypothetical protein